MAGVKGQKSGGHSTKGVAGRKKADSPLREGKQIRVSSELLEKLKDIPGKTWNDKIYYLINSIENKILNPPESNMT